MYDNSPAQRDLLLKIILGGCCPEFYKSPEGGDGAHVSEVWEDGEVTLTKGGSLFGQRSLHCISPGHPLLVKEPLALPTVKNRLGHNSIAVPFQVAQKVEQMLWDSAFWSHM